MLLEEIMLWEIKEVFSTFCVHRIENVDHAFEPEYICHNHNMYLWKVNKNLQKKQVPH